MPKVQTVKDKEDTAETTLGTLVSAIDKLNKAVDNLTERLETPKLELKKEDLSSPLPEYTTAEQFYPVPVEYIDMIKTTLNKDFRVNIVPLSDSPAFQFIVVVPDKYSNISDEYRKMYKQDLRPKVITYTDGVVGVRHWLETVFNSFNPTIQAMIVADR